MGINKTKVTETRIILIRPVADIKQRDTLVALATCVLNDVFFVGSIGIYERSEGGYRITYPTKKTGRSSLKLFYPVDKEAGDDIEKVIIDEYLNLLQSDV